MTKTEFVYVTYIQSKQDRVWNALIDREMTAKYWGHSNISDWKVGSKWEHREAKEGGIVRVAGKVVEFNPPSRMVWTWAWPVDAPESEHSRVTFELEQVEDLVRLTVTHDQLEAGSKAHLGIAEGWPRVLSSLKSFLETGKPINVWAGKKEMAAKK